LSLDLTLIIAILCGYNHVCGCVQPAVFKCECFGMEKERTAAANENLSGMLEEKCWLLFVA